MTAEKNNSELVTLDSVPEKKLLTWSRLVLDRVARNNSFNCCVSGGTGSGKSYTALSWAEELSTAQGRTFTADNVCFDAQGFMELINKDHPAGTVIILDEAGIIANSKAHMSLVNQCLSFFFQTTRFRRWIFFFCVPDLAFVSKDLRRLLHSHAQTKGIDYRKKKSKLAIKTWETDQLTGNIYRKWLQKKGSEGRLVPIKETCFNLPSPELQQSYEAKKKLYLDELNKVLLQRIRNEKSKEEGKNTQFAVLTERQDELLAHIESGKTWSQAAELMNIPPSNTAQMKKSLERHGFRFKPIKTGGIVQKYTIIRPEGEVY